MFRKTLTLDILLMHFHKDVLAVVIDSNRRVTRLVRGECDGDGALCSSCNLRNKCGLYKREKLVGLQ